MYAGIVPQAQVPTGALRVGVSGAGPPECAVSSGHKQGHQLDPRHSVCLHCTAAGYTHVYDAGC